VVEQFKQGGGAVLITTHYMEEASPLCDRVAIMDQGRLIAEGTPAELVDALGRVQFVEFESEATVDVQRLQALTAVSGATQRQQHVRLSAARGLDSLAEIVGELQRQNVAPVGLSTHQATLQDVFLQLTGRDLAGATEEGMSDAPA
jgi:ABC-2 type transport system ATP-binding protein